MKIQIRLLTLEFKPDDIQKSKRMNYIFKKYCLIMNKVA